MINSRKLAEETKKSLWKNKVDVWVEISTPSIEEMLLEQAKLGKSYLHLGQSDIRWMSNPEFRQKLMTFLGGYGYSVKYEGQNNIKITWI